MYKPQKACHATEATRQARKRDKDAGPVKTTGRGYGGEKERKEKERKGSKAVRPLIPTESKKKKKIRVPKVK